jgi:transposase-like protein
MERLKPEEGLPPCPHCKGEERYRISIYYARCLTCGKTFRDLLGKEEK